jgi:hypothetical protein
MQHRYLASMMVLALAAGMASHAVAGGKVMIDEDTSLDIGFRLQTIAILTEADLDGDGDFETDRDVRIRRGRLKVGADVTKWINMFMCTEVAADPGATGYDARVIDAYITLKPCTPFQVLLGQHMAPASRQNLTSTAKLMTMDLVGMNYKTLSWGTRSVQAFATGTYRDSDAGLRTDVGVRDTGLTLFGSGDLGDACHLKAYLGAYDGLQATGKDDFRYSGRAQLNLMDAEAGYFNAGTYLGKIKTVGIGAAFDMQNSVADSADKGLVDYAFYTADLFAELPCGPGSVTIEAGYETLDLDDATELDVDRDPATPGTSALRAQGDGFYVQAGYYINGWQPWAEFESWDSDDSTGLGSYDLYRAGLSYFIKGHNANIKAGFERMETDAPISGTTEDSVNTFMIGCYLDY